MALENHEQAFIARDGENKLDYVQVFLSQQASGRGKGGNFNSTRRGFTSVGRRNPQGFPQNQKKISTKLARTSSKLVSSKATKSTA